VRAPGRNWSAAYRGLFVEFRVVGLDPAWSDDHVHGLRVLRAAPEFSIDVRAIRISSRVDVDDARPADAPAASSEPVQVRPMDSHRRARYRPKGTTSLALVLVWPRTRLELRLRRAVARGEGGEFRSCRWQCPSMIRLGVYRGSWSMGFVIQMAAGKAEAEPHTGLLGPADNAAGGQLGAKTAIKTRGTRPSGWRLASSHGGHRSVSPHAPRSGRCPPTRKRWRRPARRPGPTLPTRSGAPR
jgi:hypothetical protein